MATRGFETLEVYRLSEQLADAVWNVVRTWEPFARRTVGANLAEGSGRGSYRDNQRFVRIARGSLYETRHWLRRAHRRGLLTSEQADTLRPLMDELPPRLNAYLKSIGKQDHGSAP